MQYVLTEISRPSPVCLSFYPGYDLHNFALESKSVTLGIEIRFCSAKRIRVNIKEKKDCSNLLALS